MFTLHIYISFHYDENFSLNKSKNYLKETHDTFFIVLLFLFIVNNLPCTTF